MADPFQQVIRKVKGPIDPGECWIFLGAEKGNGYGGVKVGGRDGKTIYAHRISYERHKGFIPEGAVVMHSCNNKRCVNPSHLFIGSHSQNSKEAYRQGLLKIPAKTPGPSGVLGVFIAPQKGHIYWRATCRREGKLHTLYHGKDFFEACCARKAYDAAFFGE